MKSVTAANIKKFAPNAKDELIQAIVAGWPDAENAGINTPLRTRHFFAQIATETGGLTAIDENLNYSVEGLRLFGSKRISDAQRKKLGRIDKVVGGKKTVVQAADKEGIANQVYGGTWGEKNLGNTQAGDGWAYRGSGFIQTTGRTNFRAAGHEDDPETLRTSGPGFAAALTFWTDHGISAVADTDNVTEVRRKINPGLVGLDHAEKHLKKAKPIFVD